MASGVAVFEDGEGEAQKAVHMDLIWGQPGGGADGIVARNSTCGEWTSQSPYLSLKTIAGI